MVRPPLDIIFEILFYIVASSIEHLLNVIRLLIELFNSLWVTAQNNVGVLIISMLIGGLFFIFVSKFLFKETASIIQIILIYGAFAFILIIVLYIFFSIFY